MRISNLSLIVLLLQQVCENDAFSSLLNQQPKATKSASLNRSNNKQHKFPLTTRYSSTLDIPTTTTTTTTINTLENQDGTIVLEEEIASAKSYLDDGFVFGLKGSGLERPRGRVATLVVEGDTLETQPYQLGIVSTTFALHMAFILTSLHTIFFAATSPIEYSNIAMKLIEVMLIFVGSWWSADLGSGVLHWSVDNYGNGRTPVMGNIIAAFQGHHSAPWTITQRQFCNNVYKLCTPFGLAPILLTLATQSYTSHPLFTIYGAMFCSWEILSQEFHKWSHMPPKDCPWWVNSILQKSGVSIARKPHALHHIAPYDGNYCIVSGVNNPWLDNIGFFRLLEHIVYKINGIESNAWKLDPELRTRTLQGDYKKP